MFYRGCSELAQAWGLTHLLLLDGHGFRDAHLSRLEDCLPADIFGCNNKHTTERRQCAWKGGQVRFRLRVYGLVTVITKNTWNIIYDIFV